MLVKWLVRSALTLVLLALIGAGGGLAVLWRYSVGLPDYQQLADYQPPTMTRVHAGDGRLLAEYALERRVFVPIGAMPALVTHAFIAAEDKNFYSHQGVDLGGVVRAAIQNAVNFGRGKRPSGASTITQQVAKNFLLTNELSLDRKIKEAILAFRIERALTKDRILELYLNEIYLGQGSYGVAAAALNYFNKSLDQLTIAEAAYLAGLPKGPNNYNPLQYPERAKARRDYVIDRMIEDGYVTAEQGEAAAAAPIEVRKRDPDEVVKADYFAEEVRRELFARYGEAGLYKGGLSVRTTLDPRLQAIADHVLREGLIAYDRHHGWRGPLSKGANTKDWAASLAALAVPPGAGDWQLAVVLKLDDQGADIGLKGGARGRIPFAELQWAKPWLPDQRWGNPPRRPADVLTAGDVVLVEPVTLGGGDGKTKYPADSYGLRQIPDIGGGLIAMDPHTGRVLAMTGGLSYEISQFNRATQAMRQPGSSFKPFVYMAALDNGFTPSTIVLDAPFVIDQGPGLPKWKPTNFENQLLGPIPVRVAIEKSKNLATVRVAESIGMDKVAAYAERFGVVDHLPLYLSMSLGATDTTLLRMTTAYGMIVNGGRRIEPTFIDRIQDRQGRTILRHDRRSCVGCSPLMWDHGPPPDMPDPREQVVDPATAYQMVSILQGVVDNPHGTGHIIASLRRPLAGKTGTTNDSDSVWFMGFSPDLVVGTYVGFDQPRTLGARDTGGSVCAPMFRDFMAEALKDVPATPFRIPPGVRLVRVDADTGRLAQAGDARVIYEAFKPGTEPRQDAPGDPAAIGVSGGGASGETLGGLY
jgi:penicillin-binding protein 1A